MSRFKGTYIDSGAVDFSDKLRTSRRKGSTKLEFSEKPIGFRNDINASFILKVFFRTGYTVVWTGEPEKTEETPLKKYQRLNCEVSLPIINQCENTRKWYSDGV